MEISPPFISPRETATGRWPRCPNHSMSAPNCESASCNSPMGRPRSGSPPSITVVEPISAATAVRKRDDVPASCASTIPGKAGLASPRTTASSPLIEMRLTCRSDSTITAVSSPSGRPISRDSPTANEAQTRARLATLFEPGTKTETGAEIPVADMRKDSLMTIEDLDCRLERTERENEPHQS